jgi:hypothetical protein
MPFVIAKFNEHGALMNPDDLKSYVEDPFAFTHVFLFAHGWWTTLDGAAQEYTRFRDGLLERLRVCETATDLSIPPDDRILAIGIAWPAMVATTLGPFDNIFEAFSYQESKDRSEWIANTNLTATVERSPRHGRSRRRMHFARCGFWPNLITHSDKSRSPILA